RVPVLLHSMRHLVSSSTGDSLHVAHTQLMAVLILCLQVSVWEPKKAANLVKRVKERYRIQGEIMRSLSVGSSHTASGQKMGGKALRPSNKRRFVDRAWMPSPGEH